MSQRGWEVVFRLFLLVDLSKFGRALVDVFFEFGMEIVHISVADFFGNLIYF